MFRTILFNELSKLNIKAIELNKFIAVCIGRLNDRAPSKKNYIRGNHLPFMNKELFKEVMHRTRLWKIFLRNRSDENKGKYSKQRNYCVSLLRKTNKNYYNNLNEKKTTNNKNFWKTVEPLPSDKTPSNEKITLIEKDKIIKTDSKTGQCFEYFLSYHH